MKKVLITGANSYIGTSFENWIQENCPEISVDTVDMRGDGWKQERFAGYGAVFHVAGIAHADVGKVTEEQKHINLVARNSSRNLLTAALRAGKELLNCKACSLADHFTRSARCTKIVAA